jgi:hypothetical protein
MVLEHGTCGSMLLVAHSGFNRVEVVNIFTSESKLPRRSSEDVTVPRRLKRITFMTRQLLPASIALRCQAKAHPALL